MADTCQWFSIPISSNYYNFLEKAWAEHQEHLLLIGVVILRPFTCLVDNFKHSTG